MVLAVPQSTHSIEYPEYHCVPAWSHSAAESPVVEPGRCAVWARVLKVVPWAGWKGIDTRLDLLGLGRDIPHVDAHERRLLHAVMRRCLRYAEAVLGRTGLDVGPSVQ